MHSFLDPFLIQAILEYCVEFPVLYSRFLLVIYFIYIVYVFFVCVYMATPISLFIPLLCSTSSFHDLL